MMNAGVEIRKRKKLQDSRRRWERMQADKQRKKAEKRTKRSPRNLDEPAPKKFRKNSPPAEVPGSSKFL